MSRESRPVILTVIPRNLLKTLLIRVDQLSSISPPIANRLLAVGMEYVGQVVLLSAPELTACLERHPVPNETTAARRGLVMQVESALRQINLNLNLHLPAQLVRDFHQAVRTLPAAPDKPTKLPHRLP